MIIVIDDERTFAGHVDQYARTSDEGLALIARLFTRWYSRPHGDDFGAITELWLDHDLGDGDDIRIVVDFLKSMYDISDPDDGRTVIMEEFIQNIYIHSQNPTTDWIIQTLRGPYGYPNVKRVPLPELVK